LAARPDPLTPGSFGGIWDLAEAALKADYQANEKSFDIPLEMVQARAQLQPSFTSRRYGIPTYYQLAADCAEETKTRADDLSEMGVYHDPYQPHSSRPTMPWQSDHFDWAQCKTV
jgi:hypothetical protein